METNNPVETPSQTPPEPVQSPTISKKSYAPIIVGISLLLIVVAGIFYYIGSKNNQRLNSPDTEIPYTPPDSALSIIPSSPTPITGTSYFTSSELKVSFDYPAEIGTATEAPASEGEGGSKVQGEEWWRIGFGKTGFEPGYYEVSASTANYAPESWEGAPHWLNAKITEADTAASVEQKLTSANYQVIEVQKIKNANNFTAFRVWNLDCFVGCILSRVYIFPLSGSKYSNLQVYAILKSLNAGDDNATLEEARTLAIQEINTIGSNQTDTATQKYVDGQDLIFNSLTF